MTECDRCPTLVSRPECEFCGRALCDMCDYYAVGTCCTYAEKTAAYVELQGRLKRAVTVLADLHGSIASDEDAEKIMEVLNENQAS